MRVAEYYWDHPALKPFLKKIPEGSYLFRQGDAGDSMFIITQGIAELIAERDGKSHVTSLLDAGDFLGERAIVTHTPHQRVFAARAKTEVTVFELTLKDIDQINKTEPELMADILKRMFQIAADRLHKTNQLVAALRPTGAWERVIRLVMYLCRTTGRRIPEGIEVVLAADSIHYFIDLPEVEIEASLQKLERLGLIAREADSENAYLIASEKALLKAIASPAESNPPRKSVG